MSARLGPRFNAVYHQTMLASTDYLCDGYFANGQLVGYLSYTADTARLLRDVFRRNVARYALALIIDVGTDPRRLGQILRVARAVLFPTNSPEPSVTAELLSVGVLPALRGERGATGQQSSVASSLLRSAVAALRARGVAALHLVAKPVHVDPVPHRFVRKYGFTSAGPVRRFGIDAEMYVLNLDSVTAARLE